MPHSFLILWKEKQTEQTTAICFSCSLLHLSSFASSHFPGCEMRCAIRLFTVVQLQFVCMEINTSTPPNVAKVIKPPRAVTCTAVTMIIILNTSFDLETAHIIFTNWTCGNCDLLVRSPVDWWFYLAPGLKVIKKNLIPRGFYDKRNEVVFWYYCVSCLSRDLSLPLAN